jgi:hypothetical protein
LCSHFFIEKACREAAKKGGQKRGFAAQKQIKRRREVGRGCTFGQFWRVCGFLFLFRRSRKKPPFLRLWRNFFFSFGVVCVSLVWTARQSQARADLASDCGTVRVCELLDYCSADFRAFFLRDNSAQGDLPTAERCAHKLNRRAVLTV